MTQTTHPEHDEELQELVSKYVAIFQRQGLLVTNNLGDFVRAALVDVAKHNLAYTAKAVEEAESRLTAKMQSEIVSPAIDDDFGTYDYKMVAENALNFIEKRLSTPNNTSNTLEDEVTE